MPMTRIITANLNGIRSAVNKGFLPWLEKQTADIVCVQEIKAHDGDITSSELFDRLGCDAGK